MEYTFTGDKELDWKFAPVVALPLSNWVHIILGVGGFVTFGLTWVVWLIVAAMHYFLVYLPNLSTRQEWERAYYDHYSNKE